MREETIEEIKSMAYACERTGQKWHFHVLTPSCIFNPKKMYAFVLETPRGNYIHYADVPHNQLGQELAPIAHKADVFDSRATELEYKPSPTMQHIIKRATELNNRGIKWHHHVTFPGCQFHTSKSEFTLVFEDPVLGIIQQSSKEEPINDLKQIEPLFYSQYD